jgi:phosphosulfolactate synthase (CoM biosynthesis protein A)
VFNLHEAVNENLTIPFGMHQIDVYSHGVLMLAILRDVFKVIRDYAEKVELAWSEMSLGER